jgi:hypothetical protein
MIRRMCIRLCLAFVCAVFARAAACGAEEGALTGAGRFLPSLAGVVGMHVERAEASVESTSRGAFKGDDRLIFPSLGLEAELMSPSLLPALPGGPRLFVHGGAAGGFDVTRSIVKEGTPGTPILPIIDANMDGIPDPGREPPVAGTRGLGSTVRSQVDAILFRAGAGIAFTAPVGDRALWIKPGVVYQRETIEVTTIVSAAESINDNLLCPCRVAVFKQRESDDSDMLGAALELEFDAARAGDFVVTLFLSGEGYKLLGNREIRIDGASAFDDGKPLEVRSSFERDPWSYAAGIGMRVRWLPVAD